MRAAIWLVLGALFLAGPARAEALPTFKDCDVCPEMVVVPAGEFIMGTDGGDKREAPAHTVTLKKSYALSETEITFDHWEACRIDGGCKRDPDDHKWGKKGMPVINIDFQDAQDYTAWLSKKTGATYRLPNEAEWEYAAKAGTTTKYWWGDEIGEGNANCRKCGTQWSGKGSAPVASFKPNPFGLYDMNGNVWEWVADCWNPNHDGAFSDGRTRTTGNCKVRIIRGGSWYYFPKLSRAAYRFKNDVRVFSYNIGFRVLKELE